MSNTSRLPPFNAHSEAERLVVKNLFDGNLVFGAQRFHVETNRSGGALGGSPADGAMHREQSLVVEDTGEDRFRRIDGLWEPVAACPVCSGTDRTFSLSRFGLDIFVCQSCTHQYMDPRIKFDKLTTLYANDETAAKIYKSETQKHIDVAKSEYGLSLIEQIAPPGRERIMDLGCGSGLFLQVAHARGWTYCVGVDANDEYKSGYENVTGVQYISSTFEALQPDALGRDYDAITLWNVLEHLYQLHDIVRELHRLLKPGGLLFIMVPNVQSLATRLIRERSATFNWKHVSHFSPKSLTHLMSTHDFRCELMETSITEIDNIKSYLSGAWPYSGYGDPEHLFDFVTPEFIHANLLGSRLIGVFRKS